MALVMWAAVLAPALWVGFLLGRVFQSVAALVLPALLSPEQLLSLNTYAVGLAVFGLVLAVLGNIIMALETGFIHFKKLWLDNVFVYVGALVWLLATLLKSEWWLPMVGQAIGALLMAPQLGFVIANVCIDDAFFASFGKLAIFVIILGFLTGLVGWLGL